LIVVRKTGELNVNTYEKNGRLKVTGIIISVVFLGGTVITADKIKHSASVTAVAVIPTINSPLDSPAVPTTQSPSSSTAGPASTPATVKTASYTAAASYRVPHGQESIQVTLAVSNGVITDASIKNSENDNVSASYQQDFSASYKSYVVGKSISGLQVDIISGASDTTAGFNNALSQIATKAQA
jgi:uncharacterized protein with FMN-binding domain